MQSIVHVWGEIWLANWIQCDQPARSADFTLVVYIENKEGELTQDLFL